MIPQCLLFISGKVKQAVVVSLVRHGTCNHQPRLVSPAGFDRSSAPDSAPEAQQCPLRLKFSGFRISLSHDHRSERYRPWTSIKEIEPGVSAQVYCTHINTARGKRELFFQCKASRATSWRSAYWTSWSIISRDHRAASMQAWAGAYPISEVDPGLYEYQEIISGAINRLAAMNESDSLFWNTITLR